MDANVDTDNLLSPFILMSPTPLRTAVYVDGLNLYHGEVQGTSYKWLDLYRCFSLVLGSRHEVINVKYFTALAPYPEKRERQLIYLDALRTYCPAVDIRLGYFSDVKHTGRPTPSVHNREKIKVKTYVEKCSDVNLAVHLLNDAWAHTFDCAVVVSNDSDLIEAIKLVRMRGRCVGVMPPQRNRNRPIAWRLTASADFIHPIPKGVLAAAQLPDIIPNTKIRKPDEW